MRWCSGRGWRDDEEIIYEKREVIYNMRRVKIESMEDMESLPEEVAKRIGDRLCAMAYKE